MSWEVIAAYVIGLLIGFGALLDGFTKHKQRKLIRDTPTSAIRSMSLGPVEVMGVAKPGDDGTLTSPVEADDAVFYTYEIEEYRQDDDGKEWVTLEEGYVGDEFYVEDETGRTRVIPTDGASCDISDADTHELEVRDPSGNASLMTFIQTQTEIEPTNQTLILGKNRLRRFTERVIHTGEDVYVFGGASRDEDGETEMKISEPARDMFLISDKEPSQLVEDRKYALAKGVLFGGLFIAGSLTGLVFQIGF